MISLTDNVEYVTQAGMAPAMLGALPRTKVMALLARVLWNPGKRHHSILGLTDRCWGT